MIRSRLVAAILIAAGSAAAGADQGSQLRGAVKLTGVMPEGLGGTYLERTRFMGETQTTDWMRLEGAWEMRTRIMPNGEAAGPLGVLPGVGLAPWRFRQFDWQIDAGKTHLTRHEVDRFLVAAHWRGVDLAVGRQAVGLGRGVLFSAVDVFSPFSPFEIDREWRRGIDAARWEAKLAGKMSGEVIGVLGPDGTNSAQLGRLRGFIGPVDGELIAGSRARDTMYAATCSAAVGGAEVHGEYALLDIPESLDPISKAVIGGSYMFGVGDGLPVWVEYHYNGFGGHDEAEILRKASDSGWVARLARGDFQIAGRNAVAAKTSITLSESWSAGAVWLASADDWSGVGAPSVTWSPSDEFSILASAYFPYGRAKSPAGIPRSEYGASPVTGFVQAAYYF